MEPLKEPISVRTARLNKQILEQTPVQDKQQLNFINRESLIDALTVLYDESNTEYLKKCDKRIAQFVDKYRNTVNELKRVRVNISDFEIKSAIGRGHFGEVHVVKEKQTGDVYALKRIKKVACLEQKSTAFEEERNIMMLAQSPWLTSLQYAFQDGTHLYFIMEYHPGGDLLGLLYRQGGTIPESAATFYVAELVLALHDLHSMGYVHRDIKLENILLDRCGHLKLADFGSAAKLNLKGVVNESLPIGTPDYIAPEVLQSMENKTNRKFFYGVSCDYWSLGVVAYELIVGNAPFSGTTTTATYNKIMSYTSSLKFPHDIVLSQAYVSLVKGLLTDCNVRLTYEQILKHPLFHTINLNNLRDQVPPYVPKISSVDDTSNFSDVHGKRFELNVEDFKTKTHFSGRNLPFIGFTYTYDVKNECQEHYGSQSIVKDERIQDLLKEVDKLQRKLTKGDSFRNVKESLEKKLEEKAMKLDSIESLRDRLERDLANNITECAALKRTLELERKDRIELERRALDLIKSAKLKWEVSEKTKVDALNGELQQQQNKIEELTMANDVLKKQLEHAVMAEDKHKSSVDKVQKFNRKSIVGLESRLERVTTETQSKISELQNQLVQVTHQKSVLENKIENYRASEDRFKEQLKVEKQNHSELTLKTNESQKMVMSLEAKVYELENNAKEIVTYRREISSLKDELKKTKSENKIQKLEDELKKERDVCTNLKKQIENLKEEINCSTSSHEVTVQEHRKHYSQQVDELELKLKETLEERSDLEVKLQEAQLNNQHNKVKVKSLEDLLARLESGVSKLESDCEKESVLKEQIERLEQQLIQVHETSALEKQELSQLKTKFWIMERDFKNADIDKRILKRELKEVEDLNKNLIKEKDNLNAKIEEEKKMFESALLELNNLNESLGAEVLKLREIQKGLEEKVVNEKEKCDGEKCVIGDLKLQIEDHKSHISRLLKDVDIGRCEKDEVTRKLESCQSDNERMKRAIENATKEKVVACNEVENCRRELQNTNLNLNALREACTLLENQLVEYEKMQNCFENKQTSLSENIEKLINELAQSKQETQEARRTTNEEISRKLMAETKCKRLVEDVECLQNECSSYKQQCMDYKEHSSNLVDELTAAEEKLTDYEVTIKSYERQIENLMGATHMLKEENSAHVTRIHDVKETNHELHKQITDSKSNNSALLRRINDLENILMEKSNFYKERELKANATIQQQTKLIDFLQLKIEESKKKKTLSDKLFGSTKKENLPPTPHKDFESLLSKEREMNRGLRQEISRLTAELTYSQGTSIVRQTPQSQITVHADDVSTSHKKIALEQLTQLTQSSTQSKYQNKTSSKTLFQGTPHRFESKIVTNSAKCFQCKNQLMTGRNMTVCCQCSIVVHPSCTSAVHRNCGSADTQCKPNNTEKSKDENVQMEGWVKVPIRGNTGWEKYYACLTPTTLGVYCQPPKNASNLSPVQSLELQPPNSHGKVILEPVLSEIGVPVVSSDLPYVLKVEVSPNTTCWPPKTLIFMTLSAEDKEKWFKALQAILNENGSKYLGETIMSWQEDIDVNCFAYVNEDKVLGTEQGLYSCHDNSLIHISGPSHVHQILLLPTVNLAVMIVDINRVLISCDLNHLENVAQCAPCSKPTLDFKQINVNNMHGFHIFQTSDFVKRFMLCVATSKQLIIMNYDYQRREFSPVRILDTAEPTSCMLFTEHSLIVGPNKFFEIDLASFEAEEFIDISDKRLSQVVKWHKMRSFPMAVVMISKNPAEFLLCFKEFGVFVDEYGRSSRLDELKWSHMPKAFYFHAPYLYITHFSSVEVIKIKPDTCNGFSSESSDSSQNFEHFKIDLNSPRYLGNGKKGVYIGLSKEVRFIEGRGVDSDTLSITTDSTESENPREVDLDSEEFSFTSSIIASLDGHLSDVDTDSTDQEMIQVGQKKVTFSSRTNL